MIFMLSLRSRCRLEKLSSFVAACGSAAVAGVVPIVWDSWVGIDESLVLLVKRAKMGMDGMEE